MLLADLTIAPIGGGTSLSDDVAVVMKIIHESGLKYNLHSMGTNVEGEFDEIMALVKKCHEALYAKGCARISTSIKLDDRRDRPSEIDRKMKVVKEKYIT